MSPAVYPLLSLSLSLLKYSVWPSSFAQNCAKAHARIVRHAVAAAAVAVLRADSLAVNEPPHPQRSSLALPRTLHLRANQGKRRKVDREREPSLSREILPFIK